MKNIIRVFTLICAASTCMHAGAQVAGTPQPNKYIALTIADSMKQNADAVMRLYETNVNVKDLNSATVKVHQIITVLGETGKEHLQFVEFSDKFRYLDDAEVNVYNALGVKLNSYSKKEMQSSAYGSGLVDDGKVTYFSVNAPSYPITVEFKYTTKYKGILDLPDFSIQGSEMSVEQNSYDITVSNEMGLRYKAYNTNIEPQTATNGESTRYHWEVAGLKAMKAERGSGASAWHFPFVRIAPNRFKIDEYEGDMSTWRSFGAWERKLIADNNELSPKARQYFIDLVKGATTDIEKARIIYQQMQQTMRYVSIQLGIGGWRPFPADFVFEKKYGDCKALSNYMQAALAAVGVKSHSAIVNSDANDLPVDPYFSANGFNHMILCIPQPKDSVWLECTSPTADFGVLGASTENRNALLITDEGGVLVSTPPSKAAANRATCSTTIQLSDDGSGVVNTSIAATGEFKDAYMAFTLQRSDDEKKEFMVSVLDWKQPDRLTITNGEKHNIPYRIQAEMSYEQIPTFKVGSKMFLQPRMYPIFNYEIPENDLRTMDYFFHHPMHVTDTTVFQLPEGFVAENLPQPKQYQESFGNYSSTYKWDAATRKLTVIAELRIHQHHVPVAAYKTLAQFSKKIVADMNEKIVVKRG